MRQSKPILPRCNDNEMYFNKNLDGSKKPFRVNTFWRLKKDENYTTQPLYLYFNSIDDDAKKVLKKLYANMKNKCNENSRFSSVEFEVYKNNKFVCVFIP